MKRKKECCKTGERSGRRSFIYAALMICTALFLTACGGSGTENSSANSDAAETNAAEETTVKASEAEAGKEETEPQQNTEEASVENAVLEAEEGTVEAWAEAFCSRDGGRIAAMCGDAAETSLREQYLLDDVEGETESKYVFGWSSPWPWGISDSSGYEIIEETDSSAVILYYAMTSDPHVQVWRETLTFHRGENGITVEDETLEMFEAVCMGEEYARAYPHGINGTPMDYLENGLGEILNDNAKEGKSMEAYAGLFEPDKAAVALLNLLDNPSKVRAETAGELSDGKATVNILFEEDGSSLTVEMVQPYGADGIWIAQDYLAKLEAD